jgi:hypothetical protein
MAMKMLDAGGAPVLTDGIRTPDDSNPNGYYEFERVKALEQNRDLAWLADARGKVVKIISFLLTWLPESYDYQVIFMQRDLSELIASQNAMLRRRGETPTATDDERLRALYERHLDQIVTFVSKRRCFSTLTVGYQDVLHQPHAEAARIREFLGLDLDLQRMADVADLALYRNRGPS